VIFHKEAALWGQCVSIKSVCCHTVLQFLTTLDLALLAELQKHDRFPPHPFSNEFGEDERQDYKSIKGKKDSC